MDDNMSCAACGKGGDDLKTCTACKAVKYCNVTCQKDHRRNHKKECKKRTAELFDEALFKQPPKEDCPICFLPMPGINQIVFQECCGKTICLGCIYACNAISNVNCNCPFCRKPMATDEGGEAIETLKRLNARVVSNDSYAIFQLAGHYFNGAIGLPQNLNKAIELLFQAAELGSKDAHNALANLYYEGQGVRRDIKKAKYHWEIAAMAGNDEARCSLGVLEDDNGNMNRAMKHWMIAASAGDDVSLKKIREGFEIEYVTKDDYEKTLRAFIVSVKEMRSEGRDRAAAST